MSVYLDTSVLVSAFVRDIHTQRTLDWFSTAPTVCLSNWAVAEYSSALSLRVRTGQLTSPERDIAETKLDNWIQTQRPPEPVTTDHVLAARRLVRGDLVLRTPDVLHLAIAMMGGFKLATFDQRLAEAAVRAGVGVVDL